VNAPTPFDVVIPTCGRSSLDRLLTLIDGSAGPRPGRVVVVDDRPGRPDPLVLPDLHSFRPVVVTTGGRGPAAARNAGWRRCTAPWIAFLDDDVETTPSWFSDLVADLGRAGPEVVAVQGRVTVPTPPGRPHTDGERAVKALETSAWITADMAVRRAALVRVGGFDERFRRAYREDTDLALRLLATGGEIVDGERTVVHRLRDGNWATSVRAQRGNADDALMRRLHGADWRARGRAPAGALRWHLATTAALVGAVALVRARPRVGRVLGALAALRTAWFFAGRVRRGPPTVAEWGRMAVSSVLIPFAATWWAAAGWLKARRLARETNGRPWSGRPPRAVLFDRDGTIVRDVPYNGDPRLVEPTDGARDAIARLRSAGVPVGLVTNQSGVGRGLLDDQDVRAVNGRVDQLLGPFDTVQVCPHVPEDECGCRKPRPGMILGAARALGVRPEDCAVVGDIGADVEAGLAVGARSILVPTDETLPAEIAGAPEVVTSLHAAVDLLLGADTEGSRA
jgi:histidinol-phosphate phosphatase family protein